jgi:hypothetical protein
MNLYKLSNCNFTQYYKWELIILVNHVNSPKVIKNLKLIKVLSSKSIAISFLSKANLTSINSLHLKNYK